MKIKYTILAIILSISSNLYCLEIDKMIESELKSAQSLMRKKTPPVLDFVLKDLIQYAKKSDAHSVKAINAIKDIKNALLQYRSEQYTSNWYDICSYFKSNPEIVTTQIDPAITKVNNALKAIQSNASIFNYENACLLVGTVIGAGLGTLGGLALRDMLIKAYNNQNDATIKKIISDNKDKLQVPKVKIE